MGVQISFNYAAWLELFPQYSYVSQPQATAIFNLATQFHRNDGAGPVDTAQTQTNLLNLVLAHLVVLMVPAPGGGARDPNVVGRLTNANEGSVTVGVENQYPPGSAQWWQQTQWGSMYWEASKPFRTARYLPSPLVRPTDPIFPGFGWPRW